jgi:putative endonuclease
MYFIYIIYSKKLDRYYVGTTDDVSKGCVNTILDFIMNHLLWRIPWELNLSFLSVNQSESIWIRDERMKSE